MEAAPSRRPSSWLDIPVELASLVLGRLPAHVDRVRFAAVCPQWRAAARQAPLRSPLPLLLLPDATAYSLPGREPFHFAGCAGYTDASGNWLVFSGEDGCFLRDPFSNATVTLPALSRVQLQHVGGESIDEANLACLEMDEGEELDLTKIIFCSPHLIAATVRFKYEGSAGIAVCQPGATSWWSIRVDHQAPGFVDIVFHQGKLYAVDLMGTLLAVDISMDRSTRDPWISQIQQVIRGTHVYPCIFGSGVLIQTTAYLVESRGALLLVYQTIILQLKPGQQDGVEVFAAEQNWFEVFEANFGQSQWTKVTTLGDDQVLFLRRRCCRSVCVSHNEVLGDCIFFLENDDEDCCWYSSGISSSCSVYSMRDGKVSTPLPEVSWKRGTVFATWLLPQN